MHYRTKALGMLGYLFSPVEKFLSLSTKTTMTIKMLTNAYLDVCMSLKYIDKDSKPYNVWDQSLKNVIFNGMYWKKKGR